MARMGVDLDGVVSLHGALSSPISAEAGKVKARVQVYTGGADPMVPAEQVAGLVQELQTAEVDLTLVSFPGVLHSFTNPKPTPRLRSSGCPLPTTKLPPTAPNGTMRFYEEIFAE